MNSDLNQAFGFLFFVFFALSFFGCSKKNEFQDNNPKVDVVLKHLKHQDVPVPVGFQPSESQQESEDPYKVFVSYIGDLTLDQCLGFYKKSMESTGWEIQDFSIKKEGLLFCNKYKKHCAISIRRINSKTCINISLQDVNQMVSKKDPTDLDKINKKEINIS